MATSYEKNAARAIELLEQQEEIHRPPELIEEFLICVALLTDAGHPASLATVLEFIDARQHVMVAAEETAGAIRFLSDRALLERNGNFLVIPNAGWKRLPRTRGKLDVSRAGLIRWQALINTTSA